MSSLTDIEAFVLVAEHGGFTAAARALGGSVSTMSRRVSNLEDRMGIRLFERSTRQVRMTEAGARYLDRVGGLLDQLREAEQEAKNLRAQPVGRLRIAAPLHLGVHFMTPVLARFCAAWPTLDVQVSYSDRSVDLVGEGFDLAIRGGRLKDENLVAKRLLGFGGRVTASPSYLDQHGTPTHPQQLAAHQCLVNMGIRTMPGWVFFDGDTELRLDVTGQFQADNGDATAHAAVAGLGIAYEPDFIVNHHINRGDLVPLLEDWQTYQGAIYALYPHRRHLPAKVRLFIDHLSEAWAHPPWS